ncbi:unnamed protein product [Mytilus edulis]|uniref:Reverse transcriptase/retrotransposon-derived protein RNase H-like domain-containing protein n=1 Tax=Mytilus edulis TaxID=6550 RepID=A0A8S3PQU5_MYTED|nr:unnamed protein product [Mytilus edulis]
MNLLRNKQQGKIGLCFVKPGQTEPCSTVDEYAGGMTIRLPGVSCDEVKTNKVPGLDIVEGKVNSKPVSVLRDTGCSTVFVNQKFVDSDKFTGTVLALVLDTPFAELIIGNYVNTYIPTSVKDTVVVSDDSVDFSVLDPVLDPSSEPCQAVQTRSQKTELSDEKIRIEKNTEKIFGDIAQYCRSCPECQRGVHKGRVSKASLISIPRMEEPFHKTDKPVYKKPYPLPYARRNKVKVEVEKMLKSGIIEPSTSPYAAPVVLVKKKVPTDASQFGLGAVLEQEFEDGRHPVIFISKKLSGAECNYAVIEKECYAIVWAVKTLRVYLEGGGHRGRNS